jgi:hypothetical protein
MNDLIFPERFFLVLERDRESNVNIWSVFDRKKRQMVSSGFDEDWLSAVEAARKSIDEVGNG